MTLMDSTKFTNIVITGAIAVFIIMGIVSLNLNYEAIQNQNEILDGQSKAVQNHQIIQNNTTEFFREAVQIIISEIQENQDILYNHTTK